MTVEQVLTLPSPKCFFGPESVVHPSGIVWDEWYLCKTDGFWGWIGKATKAEAPSSPVLLLLPGSLVAVTVGSSCIFNFWWKPLWQGGAGNQILTVCSSWGTAAQIPAFYMDTSHLFNTQHARLAPPSLAQQQGFQPGLSQVFGDSWFSFFPSYPYCFLSSADDLIGQGRVRLKTAKNEVMPALAALFWCTQAGFDCLSWKLREIRTNTFESSYSWELFLWPCECRLTQLLQYRIIWNLTRLFCMQIWIFHSVSAGYLWGKIWNSTRK